MYTVFLIYLVSSAYYKYFSVLFMTCQLMKRINLGLANLFSTN